MTTEEPPSLAGVIAKNIVRRRAERPALALREGEGLSQSGLAALMEGVGVPWTQSTVAHVEAGRRQVSSVELAALSVVLCTPIAALLDPGDAPAVAVGGSEWPAALVRRVVAGDVAGLDDELASELPSDPPAVAALIDRAMTAAASFSDVVGAWVEQWGLDRSTMTVNELQALVVAHGAEDDAVTRIRWLARNRRPRVTFAHDVQPRDVAAAAWRLWGTTYEQVHARRTAERLKPGSSKGSARAVRGHVTRAMDEEIFEEMKSVLGVVSPDAKRKRRR